MLKGIESGNTPWTSYAWTNDQRAAAGQTCIINTFKDDSGVRKVQPGVALHQLLHNAKAGETSTGRLVAVMGATPYSAETILNGKAFNNKEAPWPCVDAVFIDEASQMLGSLASLVVDLLDPVRSACFFCTTRTDSGNFLLSY